MVGLDDFRAMLAAERGLVVVSVARGDGTVHSSVVNAGVLPHPVSGQDVVGLVAMGGSVKLRHLRRRLRATIVARTGWTWAAVEGGADLIGPDDPAPGVDADALRLLLRDIFTAAGGTHDDFDGYDRVMAAERRTAVLVRPERIYGVAGR